MATSFPTNSEKFDLDDRISFSKLDNKFIAVDDDGTEFEFELESRRWTPIDVADDASEREQSPTTAENAVSAKRKMTMDGAAQVSSVDAEAVLIHLRESRTSC